MSDTGYPTFAPDNLDASRFNEMAFVFNQLMARVVTSTLVEVMAVTPGPDLKIGTVDVKPCVNQVDSTQTGTPHATIYKLPYARVQGGTCAFICDPQVGDIGWAGFCHRDISTVKNTLASANPASRRRYDWADGVYLLTVLPLKAPTSYVEITPDGDINVITPDTLTTDSDTTELSASTEIGMDTPDVNVSDNLSVGNGWSGVIPTGTGQMITVLGGIIVDAE